MESRIYDGFLPVINEYSSVETGNALIAITSTSPDCDPQSNRSDYQKKSMNLISPSAEKTS